MNPNILKYIADLRAEIHDLQEQNARYLNQSSHSAIDRQTNEARRMRLLQISEELTTLLKELP